MRSGWGLAASWRPRPFPEPSGRPSPLCEGSESIVPGAETEAQSRGGCMRLSRQLGHGWAVAPGACPLPSLSCPSSAWVRRAGEAGRGQVWGSSSGLVRGGLGWAPGGGEEPSLGAQGVPEPRGLPRSTPSRGSPATLGPAQARPLHRRCSIPVTGSWGPGGELSLGDAASLASVLAPHPDTPSLGPREALPDIGDEICG